MYCKNTTLCNIFDELLKNLDQAKTKKLTLNCLFYLGHLKDQ